MLKCGLGELWVVTVISNPVRFSSRYALYREFEQHMKATGANLVTVEMAFGDRPWSVTESGNPRHVQLRSRSEVWHKENLINVGVSRLPPGWEYMAWVDADVQFLRPDWTTETVHQLQHYGVAQLFETAIDTGPTGQALNTWNGFGYSFANGLPQFTGTAPHYYYAASSSKGGKASFWHPGYAWAMRRDTFEDVGGLLDTAILGAGDHHMALAFIGQAEQAVPPGLHPNYMKHVLQWQDRCSRHLRQNLGYVPGTLLHHWHGKKKDRRYWDRWEILKRHSFDPEADLKRDSQGLWVLSDQGLRLRNDLQRYFRQRNEDSTDLE